MPALSPALRKLFAELEQLFESETEARVATSARQAQRALAERLNQAVRRLRQAAGFAEAAAIVSDACAPFCNGSAVFHVTSDGVSGAVPFQDVRVDAQQAAAFAAAIESRELVTALCSPQQVSDVLVERFHHAPEDKAYLFPVIVRQRTVGVLYATGTVDTAALELLAQTAGAVLESREVPEPQPANELVTIQGTARAKTGTDWERLSAPDRRLHLQAQRFARVQVAEMRLYHAEAVETGRATKDLYAALKPSIDAAREAYRQSFLPAPGMTDYLHQELLHTLAHDSAACMGEKYPGPLV